MADTWIFIGQSALNFFKYENLYIKKEIHQNRNQKLFGEASNIKLKIIDTSPVRRIKVYIKNDP